MSRRRRGKREVRSRGRGRTGVEYERWSPGTRSNREREARRYRPDDHDKRKQKARFFREARRKELPSQEPRGEQGLEAQLLRGGPPQGCLGVAQRGWPGELAEARLFGRRWVGRVQAESSGGRRGHGAEELRVLLQSGLPGGDLRLDEPHVLERAVRASQRSTAV